jgi:UDP-N-acetylmuramate dehydrogenase
MGAKEHVPLSPYSTLRVGGCARYFISPTTVSDLIKLQAASIDEGINLYILSGGSNTLFSDAGFDGIVVKLSSHFDFIEKQGTSLRVGAATSFAKITKRAIALGWSSAIGWSGTPGLIGGAIHMNAGTRMGEIKDALWLVRGVKGGQAHEFHKSDMEFTYRKSSLPHDLIIYEALLDYDQSLLEPVESLMTKAQEYRLKRRLTQPTINSLGSFFKNPYPHFAAELIEKCNLKGLRYQGAQISSLHANFIVNNGGATANDILSIASIAQRAVFDQFGIVLIPEICMVGSFSSSSLLCTTNLPKMPKHAQSTSARNI